MSYNTRTLLQLLEIVFVFAAAAMALSALLLQKKRNPPWRGKLPLRYLKVSQRRQFTMCMLWAGATVCQLMLRDDPASRLFSGSLALLFWVLAWMNTRLLLLVRRLRTSLLQ